MKLTTEQKAWTLLADGKVTIRMFYGGEAIADVVGSKELPYSVMYTKLRGDWSCDCLSRVECAHIKAVKLVVPLRETKVKTLLPEMSIK